MLVDGFPAGPLAANCYLVAALAGGSCLVVDPGDGAPPELADRLRRHRLTPRAVLLTHGHFDHVRSAAQVCARYDVPCYVHAADRRLLTDPAAGLPPAWAAAVLAGTGGWPEPPVVRELRGGERLDLGGVVLDVLATPGHTPGSVTYRVAASSAEPAVLFTGDLLFAGTVGRTDLPGGSWDTLVASLAGVVLPLPDATVVHPGHGDATTVGRERAGNPFLRDLAATTPPAARR